MVNLATQLLTLVFVFVAIAAIYLLIRGTRSIESPYNKILKGIFVLGLGIVLLSMVASLVFQQYGWEIAVIMGLGEIIIGIGVIILCWEKFKEGYEESRE